MSYSATKSKAVLEYQRILLAEIVANYSIFGIRFRGF